MVSKYIKTVYMPIIVLIIITMISILVPIKIRNSNSKDFKKVAYIKTAILSIPSKNVLQTIKLPYKVQTDAPFEVIFDVSKFQNIDNLSIGTNIHSNDFAIYLQNKLFCRYITDDKNIPLSDGSNQYYIISLPANRGIAVLKASFSPRLNMIYTIDPIAISSHTNIFINMLKNESFGMILAALLIFISLFNTVFLVINHTDTAFNKRLLYTNNIILIYTTYFLSSLNTISYFFGEYKNFIYFVKYISLIFLTFPIMSMVKSVTRPSDNKLIKWGQTAIIINYTIQLILNLFNIYDFYYMLPITITISVINLIIILWCIFKNDNIILKDRFLSLLSISPIYYNILFLCISIGLNIRLITASIFIFNVYVFITYQVYIFTRNFIDMRMQNTHQKMYKTMIAVDPLTGFGNRYSFNVDLDKIRANPCVVTVICADLNNLKGINDNLGHAEGDKAIISSAKFLKKNISENIYRVGGDEFVLLYYGELKPSVIDNINNKPIYVDGISEYYEVSISLGYSYYIPSLSRTLSDVIKTADKNMYNVKEQYKEQQKEQLDSNNSILSI